jgi:23S rRNA G2069 N7-methylase RlmK/C1962 C5-methylase RlmI
MEVDSDEVILSEEHVDFKWVNITDALKTLVWNGQKEGIQMVYDMVTSDDDRMKWSRVQ